MPSMIPRLSLCCWLFFLHANSVLSDEIDAWLQTIARVGPQASGSDGAREARRGLAQLPADQLPRLLPWLNTDNVVAANWYRSAFDAIVARESRQPAPRWPLDELKAFVQRREGQGKARRLVLALVDRLEPGFRGRWIPDQLDDPEFRQEAVDAALAAGDQAHRARQTEEARRKFQLAFASARQSDQVLRAARKLQEMGENVDPIRHLGFVHRWYLLGPFDAPGMSGFDQVFPPELDARTTDLSARFPGKDGRELRWQLHESRDALGQLDLVAAIAPVREAVGFAYGEVDVPRSETVQLRCSADDNLTIWLNGQQVLAQRQWLNGTRLDRFVVSVPLAAGTNRLLVKICQGPQHVDPAVPNNWSFQLRLCDATGAGIPFENRLPKPDVK